MSKILLIEDDLSYARIIQRFLEKNGFEVKTCEKVKSAITLLKTSWPKLVITDYRLPDGNGMEILEFVKKYQPETAVILITNYSDIRIAVKAMKMGASEYITKPIDPDELLETVKEAFESPVQPSQVMVSTPSLPLEYIQGSSNMAQQLEEHIELVAPTDLSVMILGETGTGKEFVAKRIHQKSKRNEQPFVAIDCGALSNELAASELFGHIKGSFTGALEDKVGHFEYANGGTLFLDEVGNLDYEVQLKLLRAIQERSIRKIGSNQEIPVDIRIIAATNEQLKAGELGSTFREDLFHRLNEFSLQILPLRDRKEDLEAFVKHFIQSSNTRLGREITDLDEEVMDVFRSYSWPGNLRELKNIVRRAVLLAKGSVITTDLLPKELTSNAGSSEMNITGTFKESMVMREKENILKALEFCKNNKSQAAKMLGMDRKTLYNKLDKYGLT
ncbi:sigma-54-dependent transcriptional regulator [Arthrospiribacter ruber]|uniref:Sigma-54-dependent Fis family transcriptional regulator n=1 Tax=Arthrospiribacter ruber TaxID=2487934 RepID=A0A951IS48_9BACT|nr:sigma-54 dependent transcriptional regulator [Arthrospiribacter ruber]MBW3466710.1 sigma-54-dependent Fis family transcriptional regulator [Arthrospiribacter ruber]